MLCSGFGIGVRTALLENYTTIDRGTETLQVLTPSVG